MIKKKLNYLSRILSAYLKTGQSQLTFWHGKPEVNKEANYTQLEQYYMPFLYKAHYNGPFNADSIPLLNYHGKIGKQYNPIAIAQYGLGHYNLYKQTNYKKHLNIAEKQANWLVENLEQNNHNIPVWMHHFDWEYRDTLKAPWYSALAQGNGISLLLRLYKETKKGKYLQTAHQAFRSLITPVKNGGVLFIDKHDNPWFEETIVNPPTHILNGFIWTLWGIYDYWLAVKKEEAKQLFDQCIQTLKQHLKDYDTGFWSLYEQSGTKMKMLASPFYHNLHIIQLKILYNITGEQIFQTYAKKWQTYKQNWLYRNFALVYKIIFKILYY